MDNRQFNSILMKRLGIEAKECAEISAALTDIMSEEIESGNTIAIPAFGQFSPVKHDEEAVTDLSTGRRLLLPPSITLEFIPGSILTKHLRHVTK